MTSKLDNEHSFSKIGFILANVRGFRSKKLQLQLYFSELPTIAVLTEVSGSQSITPNEFTIHNYNNLHILRGADSAKKNGGGVCIYYPSFLNGKVVSKTANASFEAISVEISYRKRHFLITGVYRAPGADPSFCQSFENYMGNMNNAKMPHVLCGDFNLPDIDWLGMQARTHMSSTFLRTVNNFGMDQIVTEPTRESNILDLIFVSQEDILHDLEVGPPISDHNVITGKLLLECSGANSVRKVKLYRSADYETIDIILSRIDWNYRFSACPDSDAMYMVFLNIIHSVLDNFIPVREFGNSQRFPQYLIRLKRKSERLYKKFKRTGLESDKKGYKDHQKNYTKELKIFRYKRESQVIGNTHGCRKFWRYVKSTLAVESTIPNLLEGELEIENVNEKADVFNKYFSSVFTQDDNINFSVNGIDALLTDIDVSPYIVYEVLKRVKSLSSCGPDKLPSLIFRKLALSLSLPLSLIFRKTLDTGKLPHLWKQSIVVPIHKKGPRNLKENYRPVSLTCVPCRILESMIVRSLRNHLWRHNIISESQFGFLNNRSTVTQMLEFQKDLFINVYEKNNVDVLYLDIKKAFDSATHRRLLVILRAYGCSGAMYDWISDYLYGRTQKVKIDEVYSDSIFVKSGVPQGSCLGPLLFLIYINDVSKVVQHSKILVYADDCKLYIPDSVDNYNVKLQEDLNALYSFMESRQLDLSVAKCSVLHVGKRNKNFLYYLNGTELKSETIIRDLGLHITRNLKLHAHVDIVVNRANSIICNLFRCFLFNIKNFLLCYRSKVLPILEYCSELFTPLTKNDINRLESVQRRFTKRLLPQISYEKRLKKLQLETLWIRRLKKDVILAHKYIYGGCWSKNVVEMVPPRQRNNNLRGHGLKIGRSSEALIHFQFISHRVCDIWNRLPESLVYESDFFKFKSLINDWFANQENREYLQSLDPTEY